MREALIGRGVGRERTTHDTDDSESAHGAHRERTAPRSQRPNALPARPQRPGARIWHAPRVVDSDAAFEWRGACYHPGNLFERRHQVLSTRSLHVRRCVWLRGHPRRIPRRGCRGVLLRHKTPIGSNGWSRAEDPRLPVHHAGKPRLGAPRWWETGGRLSPGDGCQRWLSVSGARQGWAVCPAPQDASGADEREGAGRPGSRRGGGAP